MVIHFSTSDTPFSFLKRHELYSTLCNYGLIIQQNYTFSLHWMHIIKNFLRQYTICVQNYSKICTNPTRFWPTVVYLAFGVLSYRYKLFSFYMYCMYAKVYFTCCIELRILHLCDNKTKTSKIKKVYNNKYFLYIKKQNKTWYSDIDPKFLISERTNVNASMDSHFSEKLIWVYRKIWYNRKT